MAQVKGEVAEINPAVFQDNVAEVIRSLAQRTKDDPIEGIAISSHGETLIPIGADGNPVTNAILSMDRRSNQYHEELQERLGREKIYHITGSLSHPQFPVPKVMWLQAEHPDLASSVIHYDTANDYVYRKLGIPGVMDRSIASRFGGLDVRTGMWSQEIMDAAASIPIVFASNYSAGVNALFWLTLVPITAGITSNMAINGNAAAPIIFLVIFNVVQFALRFWLMNWAYKLGTSAIDALTANMQAFTRAASIMGVFVVGCLVVTMGGTQINLQIPNGTTRGLSATTVIVSEKEAENFTGMEGIDTESFKVKLKVNMFGRETPAEVEIGQVELP